MRKLISILSVAFSFIGVFLLAACSKTTSIKAEIDCTASTTTITVNMIFAANDNIKDGSAVLYVKCYEYSGEESDPVGEYKSKESVSFSGGVYTSSSVSFKGLTQGTEYAFRLYSTYKKKDTVIKEWTYETKEGTVEISTVDDFNGILNDLSGDYVLTSDLNLNGENISVDFKTNEFKGTFDGQGHTISNFIIDSTSHGLFGRCNGASIKNLKLVGTTDEFKAANLVEDVPTALTNMSFSSSDGYIGILAGKAIKSTFENIEISNVIVKTNENTCKAVGGVVGLAENSTFENVTLTNASLNVYVKSSIAVGVFAGQLFGDSFKKQEDGTTFSVKNCFAKGSLDMELGTVTSKGYVYVGGFAGDLGASAIVSNTYADTTIDIAKKASFSSTLFQFAVGGFAGTNLSGKMYIDGCAAISDINVYAGTKDQDKTELAEKSMTNYLANVGGFIGSVYKYINVVKNSVYVKKDAGINVYAKMTGVDSDNNPETYLNLSNVVAYTYDTNVIKNVACYNDSPDYDLTVLGADVKAAVESYK